MDRQVTRRVLVAGAQQPVAEAAMRVALLALGSIRHAPAPTPACAADGAMGDFVDAGGDLTAGQRVVRLIGQPVERSRQVALARGPHDATRRLQVAAQDRRHVNHREPLDR